MVEEPGKLPSASNDKEATAEPGQCPITIAEQHRTRYLEAQRQQTTNEPSCADKPSVQKGSAKSYSARFMARLNQWRTQVISERDPVARIGFRLSTSLMLLMLLNWTAFEARFYHVVPFWVSLLVLLAMLLTTLRFLWGFIFLPSGRVYVKAHAFTDWTIITAVLFFYFYGTGLYNAALFLLSTKILPFVSKTVNEIIINIVGWTISGIIGNAAYDLLKRLISKRDKRLLPKSSKRA